MNKEKLLILDGHSLMNRAFYALPPLTNAEGLHTNGIYGFITMLLKMREELQPDYVVCTFDRKAPTFRHGEYKDYKAGRKKMPPELAEQFPVLKDVLKLLAINIFEIDGFEADDLIGTLATFAEKENIESYIVTGDRDALQLASEDIKVVITKKGMTEKEVYDRQRMIDEFGVTPDQFIDVKGLMGDASDNIPGVPGIGEKTAFKLIQQYGSVESVLQNIENISGNKIKENLMQYSEQAVFSKKLATIIKDVPIEIDLNEIKSKEEFDLTGLRQLFMKLQFRSLLEKLPESKQQAAETVKEAGVVYEGQVDIIAEQIDSVEKLETIVQALGEQIYILMDIENSGNYSKSQLEKIYISLKDANYVIDVKPLLEKDTELTVPLLKRLFENEKIEKVFHDVKEAYQVLDKLGIILTGVKFDTKIAAYLIESSRSDYEVRDLVMEYLQLDIKDKEKTTVLPYLKKLYEFLEMKIHNLNMDELYYKMELPLTEVLAFMEKAGFKVNVQMLNELGEHFRQEIEKVQQEIYEAAGEEFNINSPKQLGKILFEKLDLPVLKKTKTGYSTNAEVLEELTDRHPVVEKIIYFRQLSKLYSTYIEGLKAVIDEDGKIHSSFNQTVTTTGRLSSTEPNLQNIPIKYEMGREIRKVFVPDCEKCSILSADYSQIELRVLAHIADDANLIDAFLHHSDIHTKTASEVFKVPIDEVSGLMRSRAKAVNFGIVYGISDFSLAKDLKITKKEAKLYIDTYFERYPGVKKYLEDVIQKAQQESYANTIFNRRRFIPEIKSSNKIVKALGERLAMNAPIQGSAADIIKMAMVNVFFGLRERKLKSSLILQVHDELILNVYEDELEEVKSLVKRQMEEAVHLSVPMEVDMNIGATWYEAK